MQYSPIRVVGLTRKRLAQYFGEWGFTEGAEIGVDRGSFSAFMFKSIPDLHLLCVDPWRWKQRGESRYKSTKERLAPLNATIIRKTGLMASFDIPDESLDFIHIDGDHTFPGVMTDLIQWVPKVKIGGVVSLHDFYYFRRAGVIPAVNVFTHEHGVRFYITDERHPTAFWIRKPAFGDPLPFDKQP